MMKATGTRAANIATWVVFASLVLYASAGRCDLENCPPGPVFVFFDQLNCTGAISYYSPTWEIDVCKIVRSDLSTITRNRGTFIESLRYSNSTDCGGGRSDAFVAYGEIYHFGACSPTLGARRGDLQVMSYILLNNITDAYISPQPFIVDPAVPLEPNRNQIECANHTDCLSKGRIYFQTYSNDTCAAEDATFEVDTGPKAYTCYYNEGLLAYIMYRCSGTPNAYEVTYFIDSACTVPVFSNIYGQQCGLSSSTSTTFCHVPDNLPVAQPTGSASSLYSTVMLTIVLAVFSILL